MWSGNASGQDQDCLLQGRSAQRTVSEYAVRFPRVHLSTSASEESQAQQYVCEFHSGGQQLSAEVNAASDPQAELPKSNKPESGGYSPSAQPDSQGLVGVLRAILSVGVVSGPAALQQDVGSLGDEEVQTAERPQDTGKSLS